MSVFDQKLKSLKDEGYTEIGVILIDKSTNKRCTVDRFGRVQYWDVDGSGVMIAPACGAMPHSMINDYYDAKIIELTDSDNAITII